MPPSIIHVSVKLTMRTGCTMRTLRLKRLLFVLWGVSLSGEQLRVVAELLNESARSEIDPRGEVGRAPPQRSADGLAAVSARG